LFVKELQSTCKNDFATKCKAPKCVEIEGKDFQASNWIDSIKGVAREGGLQLCILIAPGRKGASPIYDEVKYFCHSNGIASQVVLKDTIGRAKSLRNIMKNIMVQISPKLGGQPWGLDSLPLMDVPTMVVGIDVAHLVGKNKDSIVGFAASLDRYVSKYYVDMVSKQNNTKAKLQDITFELEHLFQTAIIRFKEQCGVPPKRIIVYRDS
jgi:hypothetical protein